MTIRKLIAGLISALFLMVMLAACGTTPATSDKIALPPNALPLAAGSNSLADSVADRYRKAVGQKNGNVDVQLYTLPKAVSWDQVQGFYTDAMQADWQPEANLNHDAGSFKSIGWTRGVSPGRQGVAIGYGPANLDTPPFLVVAQFSE